MSGASPVGPASSPVSNSTRTIQPGTKLALLGVGAVVALGAVFLPGGSRDKPSTTRTAADERVGEIGQRFQAWDGQAQQAASSLQMPGVGAAAAPGMGTVHLRRAPPASIVAYQAPAASLGVAGGTPARAASPAAAGSDAEAGLGPAGPLGGPGSGGAPGRGNAPPTTVAGMQVLRAGRLPQPQFWLMPGDKLLCDQVEPIVGTDGAPFTCTLSGDVKGRTSNVTLLDKGTRLVGNVVRGLDNGEERLGVSFSHAEAPSRNGEDPIVVSLNSPGADVTGQAGLDGHVNSHFWSKLGATSAYALIDLATQGLSVGAGAALGSALGGGRNSSVNVLNLGGQGRSLAQSEWGSQANRRPTFERNKGEPLTVFITHPIWFGDVVAVRFREGLR